MQDIINSNRIKNLKYDKTRKQYLHHAKIYIDFCRKNYNCKSYDECRKYIQVYADYLITKDLTPSTIHTYLAAVCCAFNVSLSDINKPIRHTSDYIRGRTAKAVPPLKQDLDDPKWIRLVEFQKRVGIRRNELKHLCGDDFVHDESGNPCVRVKKGKGNKLQLQRLLPEDVDFVKSYFNGIADDERIFEPEMFQNNQLNLHKLRADCAKKFYYDNLQKLKEDPNYADVMLNEIKARWEKYNLNENGYSKKFRREIVTGNYYLRGGNRKMAIEKGIDYRYNKLVLLYTSIFKLSHWRNDVTVQSYLLA